MPTLIHLAESEAGASTPLAVISSVAVRTLPPDTTVTLDLDGRAVLLCVRFGVLAVGGLAGPRALPGEWVRASRQAALGYANASRTEELRVVEIIFSGPGNNAGRHIEQRYYSDDERANQLCPVAQLKSGNGEMALGLDASVYVATLGRWSTVLHDLEPERGAWAFVLSGDATVNNQKLESGDNAFISGQSEVRISGVSGADVMLLEGACQAATDGEAE